MLTSRWFQSTNTPKTFGPRIPPGVGRRRLDGNSRRTYPARGYAKVLYVEFAAVSHRNQGGAVVPFI